MFHGSTDGPFASRRNADVAWPASRRIAVLPRERATRLFHGSAAMTARLPHRFWRNAPMKVSRYAVLAFATATVFGLAMSPVMAQST